MLGAGIAATLLSRSHANSLDWHKRRDAAGCGAGTATSTHSSCYGCHPTRCRGCCGRCRCRGRRSRRLYHDSSTSLGMRSYGTSSTCCKDGEHCINPNAVCGWRALYQSTLTLPDDVRLMGLRAKKALKSATLVNATGCAAVAAAAAASTLAARASLPPRRADKTA